MRDNARLAGWTSRGVATSAAIVVDTRRVASRPVAHDPSRARLHDARVRSRIRHLGAAPTPPTSRGGDAIEASLRFPDVSATEIDELQCELSVKASSALSLDDEDDELESRRPTVLPEAVRAQAVPFLTQAVRVRVSLA